MTVNADNAPRWRAGADHVESWFVRANHPTLPRAVWLKSTVLCRADGTTVAETWCSLFDGDRAQAFRATTDRDDSAIVLDGAGSRSRGQLTAPDGSRGSSVDWDLVLERLPGRWGDPLCLLPNRRLVDGRFPRSTLLTPYPAVRVAGRVTWDGVQWEVDGWLGMQGHNWGDAHSPEYAWGQCLFPEQEAMVEAVSSRIALGRRRSPLVSMLVLRRGDEELRFDRILDLWRQRPVLEFPRWALVMSGRAGRVRLEMTGDPAAMVCLGYDNPGGQRSYCLNSKTAAVRVRVEPVDGAPYELTSAHGGALEFLGPDPVPEVQPVV